MRCVNIYAALNCLCRHFSKYFQTDPSTKLPPGFTRAGNRFFLDIQPCGQNFTMSWCRAVCSKCTESSGKPVYVQGEENAVRRVLCPLNTMLLMLWSTSWCMFCLINLKWCLQQGRLNHAQGSPGCEARQSRGDLATGYWGVWSPSGYIFCLNLLCPWCY